MGTPLPAVTSALIGASKPEQVIENVKALENMKLSEEELAEIDAILANRINLMLQSQTTGTIDTIRKKTPVCGSV